MWGFTRLTFHKFWVKMKPYQNPEFGDKLLTNQAWKFIHNLIESIIKVSFPYQKSKVPYLGLLDLLPPLLLSFFFFLLYGFSPNLRPNLVFKIPCLLRPCLALQKPIFGFICFICFLVLQLLTIWISISLYFILASNLLNPCLLGPFLDKLQFCP